MEDSENILDETQKLPEWQVLDFKKLYREFKFPDYMSGIHFVNEIAKLAEEAQHHPDIEVGFGRVAVTLTTHDDGGLSPKDIHLAEKINAL